MINFDLHIHSVASAYKEDSDIVEQSTIGNAELLMEKLNEYNVSLFSITDHNRFDVDLYERLDFLIGKGDYPLVKGLLAGVEFDVQLDGSMGKCHIIAIFDAKNQRVNYQKISVAIKKRCLTNKGSSYTKSEFENLLKDIGMNVILIACQRSSIKKHDGHHNSLSESTMHIEDFILTGYIDALEFQTPRIEGILLDDLHEISASIMLVIGSDCHEWSAYPHHDHNSKHEYFRHSRARILPTFKGLLMAITSPETRINPQENHNMNFIHSLIVNNEEHFLSNGINVIIGENGVGKSTIIKMLAGDKHEVFVKNLITDNGMSACPAIASDQLLYIGQGDIVKKFSEGSLIPESNYTPVDVSKFRSIYEKFSTDILEYILRNINAKQSISDLLRFDIGYDSLIDTASYFILFEVDKSYSEVENRHSLHDEELHEIIQKLSILVNDNYYERFAKSFSEVLSLLSSVYREVHNSNVMKVIEHQVKNCILSVIRDYERKVSEASSSLENDMRDFLKKRSSFIESFINAVRNNVMCNVFPDLPVPVSGASIKTIQGFDFNAEAMFHNKDVLPEFLSKMFTKNYTSIDQLKKIDTYDELVKAVRNCSDVSLIRSQYKKNLDIFLSEMCICKRYIADTVSGNMKIGSTLGELSLVYLKYITLDTNSQSIIIIDQPEDHISNRNISKSLISYFNTIRNKKQLIIVTHNPLLVVNQDVDCVLYVSKKGSTIKVISGCLEYETEDVNILDLIADIMDGGKESIEKRLKVYGKENSIGNDV